MDTQSRKPESVRREGHFQLFSVLQIGHKQLPDTQRVPSHFFPDKRYRRTNSQDLVFVLPPGASKDFRISINRVWNCRVLLLFSSYTSTDSGIKLHDSAFASVLWEYDKDPPGAGLCWIPLNINNSPNSRCFCTEWLLDCRSRMVYERRPDNQGFHVLSVESILGKLPIIAVGDTGTIP